MSFNPDNITKEHVLKAVNKIEKENIELFDSTKFDVVINGKKYPPKEIMRYAHEEMNGEYIWDRSGGSPTNKYLERMGFEIIEKNADIDPITEMLNRYKTLIKKNRLEDELYKWKLVKKYEGQPNVDADDLSKEIKSVDFSNLMFHLAKAVMLHISNDRPEEYRKLLRVLFDESIELDERFDIIDERIKPLYRELNPDKELPHHHDERTLSTILTYHDSNKYTFFKSTLYEKYCKLIGIKPQKKGNKYSHYLKLIEELVQDYILEDSELLKLKSELLTEDCFEDGSHLLLAQDILYQVLENSVAENRKYWRIGTTDNEKKLWNLMLANGHVAIGWNEIGDLSQLNITSKDAVKTLLIESGWYTNDKRTASRKAGEIINFYLNIKKGDIVLAQEGYKVLGVGEVTDEYVFDNTLHYGHYKPVDWKITKTDFQNKIGNQTTCYQIKDNEVIAEIEKLLKGEKLMPVIVDVNKYSLNTILYGPPGTGKTYNTKNMALEILGEQIKTLTRWDITELYEQYSNAGRIEFVTFHQSFGYEDFVEGIKPVLPGKGENESEEMVYDIEDGIFKVICSRAAVKTAGRTTSDYDASKLDYYKMSLGGKKKKDIHDWCIENGYAALGWGGDADFNELAQIDNWEVFKNKFKEKHPTLVEENTKFLLQAVYIFNKMKQGDIIIVTLGNYKIDAIGRVVGDYEYKDDTPIDFYHFRKVDWILKNLNSPIDEFVSKNISQQTIYEFAKNDVKVEYIKELLTEGREDPGNYVLIIDEINRGNIASIFGELITLIEEDKRLDNSEALRASLPYSKVKFGIPKNLFILGTMNTADRSVEALDTALRRRFSFHEIKPDYSLITPARLIVELWYFYDNHDWDSEPFRSISYKLYDFLGFEDIDREKEICDKLGEEYLPETFEALFDGVTFSGINPSKLLEAINNKIEVLLDKDHCIGHSYFLKLIDAEDPFIKLQEIFRNNILPLLQEYFYGNPSKIGMVLGNGFVRKKENSNLKFFLEFNSEYDDLSEKEVFEFIIPTDIETYKKIYE